MANKKMKSSDSNPFTKMQNKGAKFPNFVGMNDKKSMKGYDKSGKKVGGINGPGK